MIISGDTQRWTSRLPRGLSSTLNTFLKTWQETSCKLISENWLSLLGKAITVTHESIEKDTTRNIIHKSEQPEYYAEFTFGIENKRKSLVVISESIVKILIQELLGTNESDHTADDYTLSPIELSMFEIILGELSKAWNLSWPSTTLFDSSLIQVVNKQALNNVFKQNEELIKLTLRLHADNTAGNLSYILPMTELLSITGTTDHITASKSAINSLCKDILHKVELPISVILGEASISLRQLKSLSQGDLIILDSQTNTPMNGYVGGTLKLTGYACTVNNRQALRINNVT